MSPIVPASRTMMPDRPAEAAPVRHGPFWTAPDRASINRPSRAAPMPCGAQVAQLVEHVTENHGVGGSIPPLGTTKIATKIWS
jgi:hypothetical protein